MFKKSLKYLLPVLFLGLAFFLVNIENDQGTKFVSVFSKIPKDSQHLSKKAKHSSRDDKHAKHNQKALSATASEHIHQHFSYKEEIAKIKMLASQLPASKSKLIALITKNDIYKEEGREIKPHSQDEIKQNQIGAAKVIALRSLIEHKQDAQVTKDDLEKVINEAADPTITKIAQAALSSLNQGRPFFNDFLDGLQSL